MKQRSRLQALAMVFLLLMSTVISPMMILAEGTTSSQQVVDEKAKEQQAEDKGNDEREKGDEPLEASTTGDDKTSSEEESSDKDEGLETEVLDEASANEPAAGTKEQESEKQIESVDERVDTQAHEEKNQDSEKQLAEDKETEKVEKRKTREAVVIEENIIKDFELTLRDGSPLPKPLPNPHESEIELKARYEFELPENHEYGAGSTYTFQLPEQLDIYNQITGDLWDVGTYVVSKDGTVTITFNENIEGHSDIDAWVEVFTIIDRNLDGSTDQTITVPIRDDQVKEINVTFEPKKGNAIDKRGTPNQRYNATTIEWEIDFNKDRANLTNAQLHDPIGANQAFVPGTIKVYALDVQIDGSVVKGEEITNHNFGTEFPLNFGHIDGDAYRVVFETEITDEEATTYPNDATLTWDDGELPASASVAVNRGKALEKRAAKYDSLTQTITWEVKYNYNEKNIPQDQAFLLDELSDNQELIEDSFTVVEVEIDPTTGAVSKETEFNNFTVTDRDDGENGFKFQFNQDIEKAYKVVYQTKASERVYEGKEIKNKVEANGKTVSGNQWINQEVFHKYHYNSETNYEEKTTKWGISVNKDNHVMNNVVLTDQLPKGLTLDSYTLTHGGEKLTEGVDYTYTYNKETGEVIFDFSDKSNPITKEIYIEYTTSFDYNEIEEGKTAFKNNAKLTWIAEGEDEPRELKREATFTPNRETGLNGSKGGSYNAKTKEITWTIGVNYNYRDIEEAIIEDIIQGNQNLDIDSIKVHHMKINDNGSWSKGDPYNDYTLEEMTVDDQPGFRINLGKINSPYVITFKTSLEGELIVKEYDNEAVLIDGEKEFPLTAKVSVHNGGNYTDKSARQNADNEQVLNWEVNINKTQSTLSNAQLIDKPSANQVILKDSFTLYGTNVSQDGNVSKNHDDILVEGEDYSLEFKEDENGNESFELTFLSEINKPYILEYDTFLMASHNEKVTNDASIVGEQITTEETGTKHEHIVKYSGGEGGGVSPKVGKLDITKIDATSKEPLEGVEFTLFDKTGEMALFTGTTDDKGKIAFNKIRFGEYLLKETKVPEGYVSQYPDGKIVTVDQEVKETSDEGNTITVENYPIIYEAQLTKVDAEDDSKVLSGAIFELQQKVDGEFKTIEEDLTTDENGVIHVKDLEAGEFQFVETNAPEGYLLNTDPIPLTIDEEAIEVVTVTAKNNAIETTSIEGTKTWKDGDSEDRPDMIKVNLLRDGTVVDTKEVTGETEWKYSFTDLPKTDALGNAYEYSVKEQPVDGYKSTVEGYDITNLRVGKTEVTGTKTWLDDNSESRPESITVKLLQNGEEIDSQEVTADDNWTYRFTDLDEFDENGVAYEYTIEEVTVEGYETTIDGNNITNLRVGKTEVSGTKTWKDDNSENRPKSITVKLLQNGKEVDSQEVTADDNWTYSFTDLDEFDENGVAYEYTVEEDPVEGYETTIDGFDITNVRVGKTEVSGTKTWKDDNPQDRPDSIKVNLLQNGVVIDTKEVTAEDDWTYSFTDLEKYDEVGAEYEYTVKEHDVPGYKSEVNGFDITNTRSEKKSIEVTKGWLDDESKDRPDTITVNLLQNGEIIETVELTKDGDWSYTFKDLEAYDENGKAYDYTIEEDPVEGYETTIDGFDITNLRVGKTEVSGTKTWKDDNSPDRPESIVVKLLQNGEEIDSQEVTAVDNWTYKFTDLDEFDENGVAYEYTVKEKPVDGYETTIDGYDLTNVRVGKTEVSGTKTWKDGNSKDRPESITVKLLQNGEEIDSQVVTAKDEWTYSFTDLDEYDEDGVAYKYSIEEESLKGYETTIDGFNLTNLRVGKTEVSGTKVWKDDNSPERPESITVTLLQNGEEIDSQEVTADDNWTYSFTNLDEFDENGVAYDYTVEEGQVAGYETTIDGYDIINVRVGITDVSGTKTWKDDNPQDRPESIKVNLLQNGVVVDTIEVTAEDDWTYSFTDLDKYDEEGVEYEYTVKEHDVPGYKSEVDGFDITNTRSEKKSIEVTKGWLDDNSENRPESITVSLLQNGEIFETVEMTKDGDWTYTFKNLEAYDENGVAYEYTIEEAPVEGYETTIDGFDITNVRVGKTEVSGTKTWKNDTQADRPKSITVNLLANGKLVDSLEVTADMGWKYAFEDLPAFDEVGKAIEYSIEEVEVPGYETHIDGFDITNTLNPSEPNDPGKPGDSNKPETQEKPGEEAKTDENSKSGTQLPKTATNMYNLIFVGTLIIVIGIALAFVRRRKINE